jgi:hypothetical protein
MKERLKSILHTAWNEPRHFFLWLALFSLCGFVAVAVVPGLISPDFLRGNPTLLFAFVASGCALCFLVSIPAFILAWIPPIRRLFAWLLGRRFLVLGCLVTLVALFYAIENWRGGRAWQNFKHEREAKGERFDMASFVPPPVPADQNFFETPLWNDMHFVETNGTTVWSDPDQHNRIIFTAFGPQGNDAPSTGRWTKGQHVDLLAWQGFYRGNSNNVPEPRLRKGENTAAQAFRNRYGLNAPPTSPPTNYFPIAKEPQTPAADVLLALSKFDENRQLLIAAAARPQARFWINYDAGFAMLLPHLARIKASAQYLALHANAAQKAGDRETALQDVKLMFRLIETIHDEPILISHLVRFATLAIAMQPVWEGLADRQWTDAQLSAIETELSKLDFLADYQLAMRAERACGVWGVDYIRKQGIYALEGMVDPNRTSGPAEWEKFLGKALFRLIPSGWFDQNKVSLCRVHEQCLMPLLAQEDRRVAPAAATQRLDSLLARQRFGPFNALAKMLLPSLGRIAEKCAYAQNNADLARVACALERYRLANGQFPDTLDALAPKFIAKLPHDLINGDPLKYRRTDDGQFVLYSVGINETDDGGKIELTQSGGADWHKGDWTWPSPAK